MPHKKSLLIGINYVGTKQPLNGCHSDVENIGEFLSYRGYSNDQDSQVILRDDADPDSPFYPTGRNILAAMDWLVSTPETTCFLHYSGHGSQVEDVDGNRPTTGLDDSIVPIDYETNGQISSTILHEHLVTNLAHNSTLFIIMDCCHSGSAVELPFVYRADSDGNISLLDNLRQGAKLVGQASDLLRGGLSMNKVGQARELYAGATSFFRGLQHIADQGEGGEEGLEQGEFHEQYGEEKKMVTMYSGCRDDQTSADAHINQEAQGAMTWAFLQSMKSSENPTYVEVIYDSIVCPFFCS